MKQSLFFACQGLSFSSNAVDNRYKRLSRSECFSMVVQFRSDNSGLKTRSQVRYSIVASLVTVTCPGKLSRDLRFKSHPKDCRSQGSNPHHLGE